MFIGVLSMIIFSYSSLLWQRFWLGFSYIKTTKMSETFIGKPAPLFKGTAVVDGEFKDISLAVSSISFFCKVCCHHGVWIFYKVVVLSCIEYPSIFFAGLQMEISTSFIFCWMTEGNISFYSILFHSLLQDYKGKYLVLFFYPLDFTFVCPTEIIAFSDR